MLVTKGKNRPLPAVLLSLAPTGQTRRFCPPPCFHHLSLRCLQRRGQELQTGPLASWPLLTQSGPINTNYTLIIVHI